MSSERVLPPILTSLTGDRTTSTREEDSSDEDEDYQQDNKLVEDSALATSAFNSDSTLILNDPITPVAPFTPITPTNPDIATEDDDFSTSYDLVDGLIQSLPTINDASDKVRTMDTIVKSILSQSRIKYELAIEQCLPDIMPGLAETAGKDVRAATYRLLRHLVLDRHDLNQLQLNHVDIYLIRSLTRDHKFEVEKEQALRLIRFIFELPEAQSTMSVSVVRAIVALAESSEEKLRLSSLEILGELVIKDIGLLVAAEGMRVVLQSLADGPHDLSPYLAMGFTFVMNKPRTRSYLRPGVDLEIIISSFTEVQNKSSLQLERVKTSTKIVTRLLKSWSGLMYLSMNGRQAITSLVESLKTPSRTVQEALLDMFFDIFQISTPAWFKTFLGNKPNSVLSKPSKSYSASPIREKSNLIEQYLAILLLIFIDAGFLEALITISEQPPTSSSPKISLLIGEILQLSNRVLPLSYAAQIQGLPRLFKLAANFNDTAKGSGMEMRAAASTTLSAVDRLNRNRGRLVVGGDEEGARNGNSRIRSNSIDDPLARGQRAVETVKIIVGMQIDDATFRNQLLESGVLSTKDFAKWTFEILFELFEGGPLLNPRRLDEAMRATKFMKRLLGFYQPYNYRYSSLRKTHESIKWTKLACVIMTTLLGSADGVRYLTENKLLRQIADALIQLDPKYPKIAAEILLSARRTSETLVGGYFEIIGVLTKLPEGIKLLDQMKIFTSLHRICDLRNRPDLIVLIIDNMDYSMDGHTRIILSKALTSTPKNVRLLATRRLSNLLQESPCVPEWQIRLLLTQLYDPSPEVCQLAVRILERLCESLETLEAVVRMRPELDHLGNMGTILLTRFLSTSIGVRYLREIDFIEREMQDWFDERNLLYVIQVELLLASALDTDGLASASEQASSFDGTPPPHFYGELVKTEEGCQILEASGHFLEFAAFIRQHGLEEEDNRIIRELKSVLWAVGSIGASKSGLGFLEMELIIQSIVEIAEDSPVYSLRGTAYFVLGLISLTLEGVEILDELGWESVVCPLNGASGICVPNDMNLFIDTSTWETPSLPRPAILSPPTQHIEKEILIAFANLSNHILAAKASKTLARLKERHRELFVYPGSVDRLATAMPTTTPIELFYRAFEIIGSHHYLISVRRFILDLFEIGLDAMIVTTMMKLGDGLLQEGKKRLEAGESIILQESSRESSQVSFDEEIEDDDDGSDGSASTFEEGKVIMPVQILDPIVFTRGFNL